jgi:hypothetical protein
MRPAGRQHSVTIPITPVRTSSDSLRSPATSQLARAGSLPVDAVGAAIDAAVEEVKLSPAGFETSLSVEVDQRTERQRHLAVAIRQRIESRLGGRVRDLAIRIRGATIVLEGRCSTFYTKQLAQHAALGVLDEEQLENAITVTM